MAKVTKVIAYDTHKDITDDLLKAYEIMKEYAENLEYENATLRAQLESNGVVMDSKGKKGIM